MAKDIIVRVRAEGQEKFVQDMKKAGVATEKVGDKHEKSTKKIKENNKSLSSSFAKVGAAIGAAFATTALINFAKQSVKLADIQLKAEAKLLTALKGRTDVQKRLIRQAQDLQAQTLFGDEVTINAQALLASLGLNEDAITRLIPLVQDLATKSGMDLGGAADLVAKSVGSSTNALSRYGITIEGAVGSSDRLESAIKSLNEQVGGQAAAAAKAGTGAFEQLENIIGDLKEEFGKRLIKALTPTIQGLTKLALKLGDTRTEAEKAFDEFKNAEKTFNDQKNTLNKLIPRYDELTSKAELSAEEQKELKEITQDIAKIVPQATESWDSYGNTLTINKSKIEDFTAAQLENLRVLNRRVIAQAVEDVQAYSKAIEGNQMQINDLLSGQQKYNAGLNVNIKSNISASKQVEKLKILNAEWLEVVSKGAKILQEFGIEIDANALELLNASSSFNNLNENTTTTVSTIKEVTKETKEQKEEVILLNKVWDEFNTNLLSVAGQFDDITLFENLPELITQAGIAAAMATIPGWDAALAVGKDKSKEMFAEEDAMQKEANEKRKKEIDELAEYELQKKRETQQQRLDIAASTTDSIFSLASQAINNEIQALENKNKRGQISDKEYQDKKAELQNRAARTQRVADVTSAIINTALGITQGIASPFPLNLVLPAIAAATGAAQIALIASQPVPQFAKGTKGKKKAPAGFKWVGEEGPELLFDGGGYDVLTAGDSEQLSNILASYSIPVQFTRTEDELNKPIKSIKDITSNNAFSKIDWNPLLNASDMQRRSLGKKLDIIHYDLMKVNYGLTRRKTAN